MLRDAGVGAVLAAIVLAGWTLRALPGVFGDFPVNDGGMFMTMADEIRANALGLPAFSEYNHASIPFAYPPLALYIAAAASAVGFATTDVLRFLPLLFTIATMPVMYLISRRLLGRELGVMATAFFAFTTGSYQWMVMGGGLTRSLGFLMALVAAYFAIRMYGELRPWTAIACGVALGAMALSHPQAAVFGGLSVPLLLAFTATGRGRAIRHLLLAFGVAALVVLPWLVVLLIQHGPRPVLSAVGTGGGLLLGVVSLVSSRTSGGVVEIVGIATTFGLIVCLARRYWLPPLWILAIAIADSRAGQPYLAVPAALAIAFLLGDIGRVVRRSVVNRPQLGWARHAPTAIAAVLVVGAFFDSLASQFIPGTPLRSLSTETRSAMAWVRAETEPDAQFVVLSGRYWALDAEAEWFPALADRRSLGTVQGSEWLGRYAEQVDRAGELPVCVVTNDQGCIREWFAEAGEVDYLFLVDTPAREIGGVACCQQLADQLSDLYETEVVHREGPVLIVRLTPLAS